MLAGLQKQMLFMRCAYESQLDHLTLFPFPGLKIVNIRGILILFILLFLSINHGQFINFVKVKVILSSIDITVQHQ